MGDIYHQPFKVRFVNDDLKQLLPNALVAPATKAPVRVGPIPIIGWQVAPRRACAKNPQHHIDELTIVMRNPAPRTGTPGKMTLQQSPMVI